MTEKGAEADHNKGTVARTKSPLEVVVEEESKEIVKNEATGYANAEPPTHDATEEDSFPETAPIATRGKAGVTDSPGFPISDTKKFLIVPLAKEWYDGLIIRDHGAFVAKVLSHERVGHLPSGNPVFRVTLGDENDQIKAVIVRKVECGKDIYEISSTTPNYPGQESVPYVYIHKDLSDRNHTQSVRTCWIYPFAKFSQSSFGGIHTLKSCQNDKNMILQSRNRKIWWMVFCCPIALILRPYLWMFAFYRGDRPKGQQLQPAMVRDQDSRQLQIQAGESMLLAICVSYAVDRMTATLM